MAIPYSPPNVTVSEVIDPSIAPLLAVPSLTALVGLSSGSITRSDIITLTGVYDEDEEAVVQDAVPLPGVPNGAKVTAVTRVEAANYLYPNDLGNPYVVTDDYTVTISANAQSDSNDSATITRVATGDIPEGDTPDYEASVLVTYTYIPENYFSPILLDNIPDIEARFGAAWTSPTDGSAPQINSHLSFAAHIAFENGASEVVCQPLFKVSSGARVQPTTTGNPADSSLSSTWASTFEALMEFDDINVIVPVVGQSMEDINDAGQLAIIQTLQDHIYDRQNENQEYAIGIFGEDGSVTPVAQSVMQAHAATIAARRGGTVTEQMVMVSPSRFVRSSQAADGLMVGGQYMAAAIAGMVSSRSVSTPITRKSVSGFLDVAEIRTKAQKNSDAGAGMMVIERKDGLVQVRHAVTLDTTATQRRELSVVRAKHRVIESVKQTIDTQIIGEVIADGEAPVVIRNAVIGVLDLLRGQQDIVAFSDVQSRVTSLDPTTVEVRFSYAPAFPVNYVNVFFSIDRTNQIIEVSESTE